MSKYSHTLLDPAKDEQIEEIFNFLEEYTEEGENDTIEVHRKALRGILEDGTPSGVPYFALLARYIVTGELANVTMFGLVPMRGGRALALTYEYTADADQRNGLAKTNYHMGVEPILAVIAESSEAFRPFGESVGLCRMYFRTGRKVVRQVWYIQSPLEEGGEEVPEHLMVGFVDDPSPEEKVRRVIDAAHAIQIWSSPVDTHEREFEAQFDGVKELMFLSADEVANLRNQDIRVIEFTEADEDDGVWADPDDR
jgi:hypothetical protein